MTEGRRQLGGNTLWAVNEPDTLYARLDGHRIAYQVTGDGPIDIVLCSGMASIDAEWDEPEIAHFNRRTPRKSVDLSGSTTSVPEPPTRHRPTSLPTLSIPPSRSWR